MIRKLIVTLASVIFCYSIIFSEAVYGTATTIPSRSFTSNVDGTEDVFGIITPTNLKKQEPTTLIVYLHGMGSNFMEPFLFPIGLSITEAVSKYYPKFVFISCSYGREASWGIDSAMRDITDNINQICKEYNIEHIIMMGSSMGGCTVLTYSATAPEDVRKKIAGVVSIESSGDLRELYNITGYPDVQPSLEKAFGGTPKERPKMYYRKSFLRNIPLMDPRFRIFLVSADHDTTVPPHLQTELYNALRLRNFQVTLKKVTGNHGVPSLDCYTEGIAFVLNQPAPKSPALPQRPAKPPSTKVKKK